MKNSDSQKSLWEYILVVASALITFGQVLAFITQSREFIEKPYGIATIIGIISFGVLSSCVFVLLRKRPGSISSYPVFYYTDRQRYIARWGLIITPIVLAVIIVISLVCRPSCNVNLEAFQSDTFGILVSDFTTGTNRIPTLKGKELADRTFKALKTRIATSSIADRVELQRACAVKSEEEAVKVGKTANATLVVWGNVAEFAQDTFDPSFTLVKPLRTLSQIEDDILLFEVELNRVDSTDLPSKISARTTSIAAFVLGLLYLTEAEDYKSAIREFTSAIINTEPELANVRLGSEQDISIRRTLAVFYVLRGRSYAALGESQKAMNDYDSAESIDATYYAIYIGKGNYYYSQRDFAQAEAMYRKALLFRDNASAYYGLGNTLFYLGDVSASIEAYLQAIQLMEVAGQDPSNVRLVLATVYHLTGQTELAVEQLNMVLGAVGSESALKERAREALSVFLTTPTPTWALFPTLLPTVMPSPTPAGTRALLAPTLTSTPTLFPTPTGTPAPTLTVTPVLPTSTPTPTATPTLFPTLFPTPTCTPSSMNNLTLFPTLTPASTRSTGGTTISLFSP